MHSKLSDMDDKILIKEQPLCRNEISVELQEPPVPQNETYFEMVPEKSELIICDTKVDIKQEPWHLNEITNIKLELQDPPISEIEPCMNIVTIKVEDNFKMGIKKETLWHDTSTQVSGSCTGSQNDEKESDSGKQGVSKDILTFQSQRLTSEATYPDNSSITFLETNQDDASLKTVCTKSVNQEASMRQKPSSLKCNTTSDSDHFEPEQNMSDKNIKVYKNKTFEQSGSSKPSLVKKLLHPGSESYRCDCCEKCFTRKSSLRRHTLLHSSTKAYKCDKCQQCFARKTSLQSHTLLHSGTKPYKCDHCDKCFTQRSTLLSHILLHSGTKPYKCDQCEKCFTQKSTLQRHKLLHSGKPPYKCDICEKCFIRKSYLQKHKLLHSGTTPFKCDICKKCFIWESHLHSHTLVHSSKRPFQCDRCEKHFIRKSHLRIHSTLAH